MGYPWQPFLKCGIRANTNLEQLDMPERNHFVGWYIKNQKTFFQYKISMKLLKNTVGSGYNLSDDRSNKVQYIDPIIGYSFVSMDDP